MNVQGVRAQCVNDSKAY